VPDDDGYDFGKGAGFYVDATQPPFAKRFRMWSYVTDELPTLVAAEFPADLARQSIMRPEWRAKSTPSFCKPLRTPLDFASNASIGHDIESRR